MAGRTRRGVQCCAGLGLVAFGSGRDLSPGPLSVERGPGERGPGERRMQRGVLVFSQNSSTMGEIDFQLTPIARGLTAGLVSGCVCGGWRKKFHRQSCLRRSGQNSLARRPHACAFGGGCLSAVVSVVRVVGPFARHVLRACRGFATYVCRLPNLASCWAKIIDNSPQGNFKHVEANRNSYQRGRLPGA